MEAFAEHPVLWAMIGIVFILLVITVVHGGGDY